MRIETTKPATEHNATERAAIYRDTCRKIKATMTPNCGRFSGQQIAYIKGAASKAMTEAGF